jgi:AraC-like DNA-binding protein
MEGLIAEIRTTTSAWTMSAHFHGYYEIYYLRRGSMRYVISDNIFEVNEGEVILIPEGVIHNTVYDGTAIERYLINFSPEFVSDARLLEVFGVHHMSLSAREIVTFEELFKKLVKESRPTDEYSEKLARRYVEEILICLIRNGMRHEVTPTDVYTSIMHSAMKYINESFSSPITLDLLACKYSLSRSFFSRKFREVTGFGLSEYITIVRIKNAARLLSEKKMNVTEAAFAVGYNDSSYFTSSFKKIMGVTPLKYAKNNSIR